MLLPRRAKIGGRSMKKSRVHEKKAGASPGR